jgi:hypothetical protein
MSKAMRLYKTGGPEVFHWEAPRSYVRVVFLSYPKGSGYTAGEESPTAALNCVLRSGHTAEDKAEMLI